MKELRIGRAFVVLVFVLVDSVACSQNTPPASSARSAGDNWDDRAVFRAGLIQDE